MIKKFPNLYKPLTYNKMKKINLKSKKLLTTALFITSGLTIFSHSNPVKFEKANYKKNMITQMTQPVKRKYDVLLERSTGELVMRVGGS